MTDSTAETKPRKRKLSPELRKKLQENMAKARAAQAERRANGLPIGAPAPQRRGRPPRPPEAQQRAIARLVLERELKELDKRADLIRELLTTL